MKLKKLEKYYDKLLFSCKYLEIKENGLYYLKGKNGVGKSTLLKMISGQDTHYIGKIEEINSCSFYQQNTLFLPNLTFKQSLDLIEPYNKSTVKELLDLLKVSHLVNKKSTDISIGEKQRLELILALAKESNLYLLDEPFSSLNSSYINELGKYLKKISSYKIIIISSHTDLPFYPTGIITISHKKIDMLKQEKGMINDNYQCFNKSKTSCKKLKYFIFNKGLFLLNYINLISTFVLLFTSLNLKKELFKNIEKQNNFSLVYVIEKYNKEGNMEQFLSNLGNYNCTNDYCYFSLKGNRKTLDKLNNDYPYLHFYSLETEAIDNIMIKLENLIDKVELLLLMAFLFSLIIIIFSEVLSYILNIKKHRILKHHLSLYWQYLFLYYSLIVLSSFLFSKILVKILYKFLLS